MNDNFNISELLSQLTSDTNNDCSSSSDSSHIDTSNTDKILNLLLAIKPFVNVEKQEKLNSYLTLMNFKSIFNIFRRR